MSDDRLVSNFESYVDRIGGNHQETILTEIDDDEQAIIICDHGGTRYQIREQVNKEFFTIRFRFSLIEAVASRLTEDVIEDIIGEEVDFTEIGQIHEGSEVPQTASDDDESEIESRIVDTGDEEYMSVHPSIQAAKEVVESIDSEVMERFIFNLFQDLANPFVATTIMTTDSDAMREFRISRKVFPEDEGFNLTEFSQSVQGVISLGIFGRNTVGSVLTPEIDIPGGDESE